MKFTGKKTLVLALAAIIGLSGLSIATPAHADWYDGHRYHHGHPWRGYHWDPRLGYYVYAPGYVYAPPPTVVVAQPAPPPVVVAQPAPVYYAAPQPPPFALGVGVHIR